jgi:hypothetical protein
VYFFGEKSHQQATVNIILRKTYTHHSMDNKKVTVLTAGGVGNTAGTSGNNSRNSRKKNKSTKQKQQQQQQQQQQNSTSKPSPRRVTSEKPNDVALSSAAATAAAAAATTMTTTTTATTAAPNQEQAQNSSSPPSNLSGVGSLEYHTDEDENILGGRGNDNVGITDPVSLNRPYSDYPTTPAATSGGGAPPPRSSPLQGSPTGLPTAAESSTSTSQFVWLFICFFGIMASFVAYGLLLEYATSGGRTLHELSFLFVTSGLYTITAAAGRYVRDETPTTIAPSRFAILGLTSMGSTFFSVRSLRYVYVFSTSSSCCCCSSSYQSSFCVRVVVSGRFSLPFLLFVFCSPLQRRLSMYIDMSFTPFKSWPRVANLYRSCSWVPLWVRECMMMMQNRIVLPFLRCSNTYIWLYFLNGLFRKKVSPPQIH